MANLQERRDKDGKLISYSIRVYRGRDQNGKMLKPWTTTFNVPSTWSEKSARKKAMAYAANFEKACREGTVADTRRCFGEYATYVIDLREARGMKPSTVYHYRHLANRINVAIGHLRLSDIRPDHLNDLYTDLARESIAASYYIAKIDLAARLKERGISKAAFENSTGVSHPTLNKAIRGERVSEEKARAIAKGLHLDFSKTFRAVPTEVHTRDAKSVIAYHRFIHTVLEQAVKEGLIFYNVADRVTLPKTIQKDVNYFQPDQVTAIRDALEEEPLKWKTLVHLLLITGCRIGELLGLKWDDIDFEKNRLHICRSLCYLPKMGTIETTPKTAASDRHIVIPQETADLLKQYQAWQIMERHRLNEYYVNRNYVFALDDGQPMGRNSVTSWLDKFSKRHGLPHLNPHAFRHTMASLLYFNGVDSVSISKRLGHSRVSTTCDIYAHIVQEADQKNADILAEVFLGRA